MKDEGRSVKFQVMVSRAELAAVDEYRWTHRLRSRAEAFRQLVVVGMSMKAKGPAEAPTSPSHDQNPIAQTNGGVDA